jgi:hypothetical protein
MLLIANNKIHSGRFLKTNIQIVVTYVKFLVQNRPWICNSECHKIVFNMIT